MLVIDFVKSGIPSGDNFQLKNFPFYEIMFLPIFIEFSF